MNAVRLTMNGTTWEPPSYVADALTNTALSPADAKSAEKRMRTSTTRSGTNVSAVSVSRNLRGVEMEKAINVMIKVLIAVMIVAVILIIISQLSLENSNETLERTQYVERITE